MTLTRLKPVGDELFVLGHGVWRVDAKSEYVVPSKTLVVDIAQTSKGTLVAVGTNGAIVRRAGKSWKASKGA